MAEELIPSFTDRAPSQSGLLLPHPRSGRPRAETPARVKAVDLFAGCGGFSLGLIQAGIEVVAAVEWDFAAALTYMTNLCRYGRQVQNAQAKTKPPDKSSAAQLELFLETAA